jgi:hypothetical protein
VTAQAFPSGKWHSFLFIYIYHFPLLVINHYLIQSFLFTINRGKPKVGLVCKQEGNEMLIIRRQENGGNDKINEKLCGLQGPRTFSSGEMLASQIKETTPPKEWKEGKGFRKRLNKRKPALLSDILLVGYLLFRAKRGPIFLFSLARLSFSFSPKEIVKKIVPEEENKKDGPGPISLKEIGATARSAQTSGR